MKKSGLGLHAGSGLYAQNEGRGLYSQGQGLSVGAGKPDMRETFLLEQQIWGDVVDHGKKKKSTKIKL